MQEEYRSRAIFDLDFIIGTWFNVSVAKKGELYV
jgi:hypothetical protein